MKTSVLLTWGIILLFTVAGCTSAAPTGAPTEPPPTAVVAAAPTATTVPPTATFSPVPPTASPLPPTATPTVVPPSPTAVPATATAAPAKGDPAEGAKIWPTLRCARCHGPNAEGKSGPQLAGTGLTFEQVLLQVRVGADPMPAFTPAEVSDRASAAHPCLAAKHQAPDTDRGAADADTQTRRGCAGRAAPGRSRPPEFRRRTIRPAR